VAVSTRSPRPLRPMKVSCLGTQCQAQPGHFGQPPCNQGCTGIQSQLHAIAQARGNGQYILHGTAHFDTDHIVIGIDPQCGAMEGCHHASRTSMRGAGRHQGSGLPNAATSCAKLGPLKTPARNSGQPGFESHGPSSPGAPSMPASNPCTARQLQPCSRATGPAARATPPWAKPR
jgi:hypothetical protein